MEGLLAHVDKEGEHGLERIVIRHPTEDWALSSLPEKLTLCLKSRNWSSAQRSHLHSLIRNAKQLRAQAMNYREAAVQEGLVGGTNQEVMLPSGTLLSRPLRKCLHRDRADERLHLEKTILTRAMIQCDLLLPQPKSSSTLAYLAKHHRIPPSYIERIAHEATPGGSNGFIRLLEDHCNADSLTREQRPNGSSALIHDLLINESDSSTLATLLLMDASASSSFSVQGHEPAITQHTSKLRCTTDTFHYRILGQKPNERLPKLQHDVGDGAPRINVLSSPTHRTPSPTASLARQERMFRKVDHLLKENKFQLEPYSTKSKIAAITGGPSFGLCNDTQTSRDAHLLASAAEDMAAVVENKKRQLRRLHDRQLLSPPLACVEGQNVYSPVPDDERRRCDVAWHDHPFYMCLDEENVRHRAEEERLRRQHSASASPKHTEAKCCQPLLRYASIMDMDHVRDDDGTRAEQNKRLMDEALDWTTSGPVLRSDAEQRYLAIQLLKERQHAIFNNLRAATHEHKPAVTSPSKSVALEGPRVSARLQQLSTSRQHSRCLSPPRSFAEEHRIEMAHMVAEATKAQRDARSVSLPVFLNIRSFA